MIDFAALKVELTTDPVGLGYDTSDTEGMRVLINTQRNVLQVERGSIDTQEIFDATDFSEVTSTSQQLLYGILVSREQIAISPALVALIQEIFPPGANSRSQLAALRFRDATRAEELFGVGTRISARDIVRALSR